MLKHILIFTFLALSLAGNHRILQILRILSPECNYHGHLYNKQCFCEPKWTGPKCAQPKAIQGYSDYESMCDDLISRLDYLTNISPDNYEGEDDEFPRLSGDSIGEGKAAYGEKGALWQKMHDFKEDNKPFRIFGDSIDARDIRQGAIGNCYALAAFAALSRIRNGEIIRNSFVTQQDNDKHVYITRWMVGGKPRFVAVDEWVPIVSAGSPSFSKITSDNDYWAIILEKAWAKIHGTYMATEYGWQTEVWKALTQAPIFEQWHRGKTGEEMYTLIKSLIEKGYPVGAATSDAPNTNEVSGHAYAVLGAYEVTRSDGKKEKLIKLHNPWSWDYWKANPWGDDSSNWTEQNKKEADYVKGEDGIFYNTLTDFVRNFGVTNWAEYDPNYDVSFTDLAVKGTHNNYEVKFTVANNNGKSVYIYLDIPETRILLGCEEPFSVNAFSLVTPKGETLKANDKQVIKISNAQNGQYTIKLDVEAYKVYIKYLTVTAYAPSNTATFVEQTDKFKEDLVACSNNCNDKGRCNTLTGECKCFNGWTGYDCSQKSGPNVVPKPNPNPKQNQCYNLDYRCEEWAKYGDCDSDPTRVRRFCRKSCKTCDYETTGKCSDEHQSCRKWSEQGLCGYDEYVQRFCRKSCFTCDKPVPEIPKDQCKDKNTHCQFWADQGECKANPKYMRINCRVACKENCTPADPEPEPEPVVDANCKDDYDTAKCQSWAEDGECYNNPTWMKENCKLSCKVCVLPGPRPKPEPKPKPKPEPEPEPKPEPEPEPKPEECKDKYDQCEEWKSWGHCELAKDFMSYGCPKLCGFCK